jgi:hypothetical protein
VGQSKVLREDSTWMKIIGHAKGKTVILSNSIDLLTATKYGIQSCKAILETKTISFHPIQQVELFSSELT